MVSIRITGGFDKKVVVMFNDEIEEIIEMFVGLRAKLYSYKIFKGQEEKNLFEFLKFGCQKWYCS